jgi:hypothetical protein
MTEPDPSGSTATETPTSTATTSPSGGGGGGTHSGRATPARLPLHLEQGQHDPDQSSHQPRWIAYLQQMLNYHYQQEVVPDSGEFEWLTARAVRHFREQNGLPEGEHVDHALWGKLGVEDTPEDTSHSGSGAHDGSGHADGAQGGDFTDVQHPASMVDVPDSNLSWAASLAIMANTKGNSYTVDSFCEHVGAAKEPKSWQDAESVALGAGLGFLQVTCNGDTAEGWATVLNSSGSALWVPDPTGAEHMIVVAGIRHGSHGAEIHVLDPSGGEEWMPFTDFTTNFGMTDGYQGELLAIS